MTVRRCFEVLCLQRWQGLAYRTLLKLWLRFLILDSKVSILLNKFSLMDDEVFLKCFSGTWVMLNFIISCLIGLPSSSNSAVEKEVSVFIGM